MLKYGTISIIYTVRITDIYPDRTGSEGCPLTNCDSCANFVYDEELEYNVCLVDLDEDELYRFMNTQCSECPYYRPDDEYAVVRHQM